MTTALVLVIFASLNAGLAVYFAITKRPAILTAFVTAAALFCTLSTLKLLIDPLIK